MTVRLYATLRAIAGSRSVELPLREGDTARHLVDALIERWPEMREHLLDGQGALSRRVNVFVDGRSTRWLPEGEQTRLDPGQALDVFPAVAGG